MTEASRGDGNTGEGGRAEPAGEDARLLVAATRRFIGAMIGPSCGVHESAKSGAVRVGVAGWMVALALVACGGDDVGGLTDSGSSSGTGSSTGGSSESSESTSLPTTSGASEGVTTTSGETTTTTSGPTTGDGSSTTEGVETTDTTVGPGACGDGVLDAREQCDGAELGGQTCETQGFGGGALGCTAACALDTQGCATCGNDMVEAGEDCDDGNTAAGDGCDAACKTEAQACEPDGVYTVQGPAIGYTCCIGLVTVNINAFTLSADGATIASNPSNPVPMLGAATTCPDGAFANKGEIQGGCTESYEVSGSFTDADTWTGEYKLTFTGDQCSCFNGMVGTPCVNQVFPVTAKR